MNKDAIVTIEFRFYEDQHGTIYTDSIYGEEFWLRYLEVFDTVTVVARTKKVTDIKSVFKKISNPRIKFISLPHYIGPVEMLKVYPWLSLKLDEVAKLDAVFILRVPSFIAIVFYKKLLRLNKGFAVEVVGDPLDVFTANSFKSYLTNFYKNYFYKHQKLQCSSATGASYVTEYTLQKIYPPNKKAITSHYSSIELPDEFYSEKIRLTQNLSGFKLIFVGTLAVPYKGLHLLLEAIAQLNQQGFNIFLKVIGDGQLREHYQEMAVEMGLSENVIFVGYVSDRMTMKQAYEEADLFVTPTLAEGLPRVVIEAMATGLPVIGTNVGGIPELIDREMLVEPNDVGALTVKIKDCLNDTNILTTQAEVNRRSADNYRFETLQSRRTKFFYKIAETLGVSVSTSSRN